MGKGAYYSRDVTWHHPPKKTLLAPAESETAAGGRFTPSAVALTLPPLESVDYIQIATPPAVPSPPFPVPVPPASTSATQPTAELAVAPWPAAAPDPEPTPYHIIRELGHEADRRRLRRTRGEIRGCE